ncbi:MAG: lactate racemase domain-containing protein [Planctomycetota bacterium]
MPTTLTYGRNATCLLEEAETDYLRLQSIDAIPADQIPAVVQSQLADPLAFPPLAQCTIPGDTVVVAVEPGVPQPAQLVSGVIRALSVAGAEPTKVTVLLASNEPRPEAIESELAAFGDAPSAVCLHNPDDEKEMAFLGVSQAGSALRLNRLLCDADVVLPVGASNPIESGGDKTTALPHLFPAFSDSETIARLAVSSADRFPNFDGASTQEISDCYTQLGAQLIVRAVPSATGQVASVIAGEFRAATRAANDRHHDLWRCAAAGDAQLVIATITGEDQQSWDNLARAISAATAVLEPDGAIALCTELAEHPGSALQQLAGSDDPMLVEREISRTPSFDCGPAMVICRALQQHTIYLRSNLKASLVESLGITPIESDQEVERLAQTHRPCIVLEDAHWLQPTVAVPGEEPDEDRDE